ncbi:POT family MFS transporter [Haloferula sp. BvORR071]|uniref:POT family MFS transporter n=1 Tax=Haloferula sp. BvORR071 TaxID=1396141 RepID=UPI0005560193|nr:POT family MFS transporter [Haloferula sp. BvORR071]
MSAHRTVPVDTNRMPPGIPYIVSNEAAERFSYYGMRTILVVFMAKYLWLLDGKGGTAMSNTQATEHYHTFSLVVYFTPLFGALLSDIVLGKYRTIIWLSIVYCMGHAALACMGMHGNSGWWLFAGLALICIGSGGIKPCVSAHVGDQFGAKNTHLLTKIYNWFYFSINFGSFVSTLLTPWLLEWYGPHWAFGVPGVLMALATLMFWMGRNKFVHIPPAGLKFFDELFSRDGLVAIAKLVPLFVFIAAFWALYDQTGSSWVFQAAQMDLNFLGVTWLESQIQAVNPILILSFIPLFTFVIYPVVGKVFKLTPLRKIGIGFVLMVISFGLTALIQQWIDGGAKPSIGWQFLAYILITASEIMVSIVGLEFAYTQAPKTMKSMIMSLYLLSVALGNFFTAGLNHYIQIPSAATVQLEEQIGKMPKEWRDQPRTVEIAGYDKTTGTADDFEAKMDSGAVAELKIPGQETYQSAAKLIEGLARAQDHKLPAEDKVPDLGKDPWGQPIRYKIVDATSFQVISNGPEGKSDNQWNQGLLVTVAKPAPPKQKSWLDSIQPAKTWLEQRKEALGIAQAKAATETTYEAAAFSGGQTKLEGAAYFRFFTWLMLATTVLYIPFAIIYRPKTYLQTEADDADRFTLPPGEP